MTMIRMKTPLVEMDGDEMTRVLWADIKQFLLKPFIDLKTEYYDLGLKHRDETADQVTVDAANAIKRLGVGVKCATITPNAQRVEEYKLHEMWKSPNGTIRAMLDGTCFRAPIMVDGLQPVIPSWEKPIIVARHGGEIPRDMDSLLALPGVGRKIANLVLGDVYGLGGIVADTHFMRICSRLGFTPAGTKDPLLTERVMEKLVPRDRQSALCHRSVLFGREVCDARSPRCGECELEAICAEARRKAKADNA